MLRLIKKFSSDENGATAIEYALIGGLIAVSVISGASLIGNTVNNTLTEIGDTVEDHNNI
ncbi:MAG: Flp family type IVb pilin [Lentilitoribacter sp.]